MNLEKEKCNLEAHLPQAGPSHGHRARVLPSLVRVTGFPCQPQGSEDFSDPFSQMFSSQGLGFCSFPVRVPSLA